MDLIIRILILLLGVFLVYRVMNRYSGVSISHKRNIASAEKAIKQEKKRIKGRDDTEKMIEELFNFLVGLGIFRISDKEKKELDYYALRLNIVINDCNCDYKYIYIIKAGIASVFGLIVSFVTLFNIDFIIAIPVTFIVYRLPDIVFDSIVSSKDKEIEKDFDVVYSKFYYRLKIKQNLRMGLADIAKLFLPNPEVDSDSTSPIVGEEMTLLCKNFIADCSTSEQVALNNLKENYRIPNVQRMAILILNTINGSSDSVQSLDIFKQELDLGTREYLNEQLEKKEEMGNRVIYLCYFIIIEILIIYAINIL